MDRETREGSIVSSLPIPELRGIKWDGVRFERRLSTCAIQYIWTLKHLHGLKPKPDKFTEEIHQPVLNAKEITEMQIHGV